jgi:glucosylglycerol-phosphate synthase
MYSSENTHWATFREVNRLFAEAACEEAAAGAVVWVHDYNLWLVPRFVRQLRPDLKIAFFHHTPFPAPDVFNLLPWRDEILDNLLCCDLVGFHVPRYACNFAAVAQGLREVSDMRWEPTHEGLAHRGSALAEPLTPTSLRVGGQVVHIDAFPIGTHARLIEQTMAAQDAREQVARIRAGLSGRKVIVSVGRVDYAKGTRELLLTYERLLRRRPTLQGQVQLLLTAVAADDGMRVYRRAQQAIEQLVGRINGHFGTLAWQPVVLSTTPMTFQETMAYFRAADVCWITPLRDGLNLVAKEFVAAHDARDGVLVLSEFAGAALELGDAVLVNPYSISQMDAAIDRALDMEPEEQHGRMVRMQQHVQHYDIDFWTRHVQRCFEGLREKAAGAPAPEMPAREPV